MATVYTPSDSYKCGAGLNFPIVKKSPYADWRSLLVRVKVTTAGTIYIGALVIATTTAANTIDISTDGLTTPWAIVPDVIENKAQLEIDNSAKATKLLFFAANSYIWILPLIPGFIVECRAILSGGALDAGSKVAPAALGAVRLHASLTLQEAAPNTVTSGAQPAAKLGILASGYKTDGNSAVYVPVIITL